MINDWKAAGYYEPDFLGAAGSKTVSQVRFGITCLGDTNVVNPKRAPQHRKWRHNGSVSLPGA
jgi:hypothetical protein